MADKRTREEVLKELDDMSRDLLLLTRTVAIYPEGHPQIAQMAERLATWASNAEKDEGVTVGVTGTEMLFDGQFYGGSDTRVENLAKRLHQKRIARINWKKEVSTKEVYGFARTLSDQTLMGEEITKVLEEAGVVNISIVPLDIGALHDRMRVMDIDFTAADRERRKRLWQWLQEVAGNPKELGRTLGSEDFWKDAFSDDPQAQAEFVEMLAGLGTMVDRALQTVPDEIRADIGDRLSKLGEELSPENLAKLIDVFLSEGSLNSGAMTALMRHITGERMASLLGGMVSMGGDKEERIALFIKKFIPQDTILGLAGLVRDWKAEGAKMGFASEIWEWLESFLLDIDENEYMGDGYRATLDRMAEKMRIFGGRAASFGFYEDPETHIDNIAAGLVLLKAKNGETILSQRMTDRIGSLDTLGLVAFLDMVDNTVPQVFKSRSDIFEKVFKDMVGSVKDFSPQTRAYIVNFAKRHQEEALVVILRQLAVEERLSVRRFLVEVLGQMSRAIVPRLIQSTRNAPWYYTRNIAIVFGMMADERTVPFLRSLLENQNSKLRKEAIRSLSKVGDPSARRTLMAYTRHPDAPPDEVRMAEMAAERMRAS